MIAIIMMIALIAPLVIIVSANTKPVQSQEIPGEIRQTAADISNMTGVPIENIITLKQTGLTWNEVLDKLKKADGGSLRDKDNRLQTLAETGIGDELVQELIKQGLTKEAILEAKMAVERVQFQLSELVDAAKAVAVVPKVEVMPEKGTPDADNGSAFREVAGKFDAPLAIRLILRLKQEFGSLEAALDEYLFALQSGLNLEDYLKDRDAYKQTKEDKRLGLLRERLVTVASIEQAILEQIGRNNRAADRDELPSAGVQSPLDGGSKNGLPDVPSAPMPAVKDVKPKNPTEELRNELRTLNPNK